MLICLSVLLILAATFFLALQSRPVSLFITAKVTDYFARNTPYRIHAGEVSLSLFGKLILREVWMEDQQGDTLATVSQLSLHLRNISLRDKQIRLELITLDKGRFYIRKQAPGAYNFSFLLHGQPRDSLRQNRWSTSCRNFRILDSDFVYADITGNASEYRVEDINLHLGAILLSPDSMQLRIASLALTDSRGLRLENLSADLSTLGDTFRIRDLSFKTDHSAVDGASLTIRQTRLPGTGDKTTDILFVLPPSLVSAKDLALFLPAVKGMEQRFEVSAVVSGNPEMLKAKKLVIRTGDNTTIDCDLSVSFYEEVAEPFIFLDLNGLTTDFRDLSRIRLPDASKVRYLQFPENLYQSGTIRYKGNFTGFPSDFVAYGTLRSAMGTLKTDLLFAPGANDDLRFNGKLETADFRLGKLLQTDQVEEVSLNGMVKGTLDRNRNAIDADFDGLVSNLRANHYNYRNILLEGRIQNKKFDGNVTLNDPNLKLNFAGAFNLNEKIPVFDFIVHLRHADLVALRLDTLSAESNLSMEMTANFSGGSFDNFEGLVQVYNGSYRNQNGSMEFDNLSVATHRLEGTNNISLFSDYVDGTLSGEYHFSYLTRTLRQLLAGYLPAFGAETPAGEQPNQFGFSFDIKDLDEVTAVFMPGLKVEAPFSLHGKIDSRIPSAEFFGKIPSLSYNRMVLDNITIGLSPGEGKLGSGITMERAHLTNGIELRNVSLTAEAADNRVVAKIGWDNREEVSYRGEIRSVVRFIPEEGHRRPVLDVVIDPSSIVLADTLWQLSRTSLRIDSASVAVHGFSFRNQTQEIALNGIISPEPADQIRMDLANIGLPSVAYYLKLKEQISGTINGSVWLSDPYNDRLFRSDLSLKGFAFRGQEIGDIRIDNQWDRETGLVHGELKIGKDDSTRVLASGSLDPRTLGMDFTIDFTDQPISVLNTVIRDVLTGFHGSGTGKVRLQGTPRRLQLDGAIFCREAGLTVGYTRVPYRLNDSIRFSGDKMLFNAIGVRDPQGRKGLFSGTIRHDSFQNMDYNLRMTSPGILAINTGAGGNEQFYGKAVAAGTLSITGHGTNVLLAGEATSLPETSVTIVLGSDAEVTRYDFVRFVSPDTAALRLPTPVGPPPEEGFEMDLVVHVTPAARVQMIYNTQISDLINAQGEGSLRFRMDKAGSIFLSGDLEVVQGEYLFTLQDVINKRFLVDPGGTLTWSGDPYNAAIDLKAVYKLKASLYELMAATTDPGNASQRVPVECKIMLTGELISPDIGFDILFPDLEARLRDELQQFFSTQEDLNRQMLSLLVLGRFYTPEYIRGSYVPATGQLIGNTASDLFSSQLSNWLSRINKDVDIGFNYRPGNQITDDEIELALSTQIFNDRVTINGNIANNTNPTSMNNSELVGDFEINVKLTPNGKLQLKAYNRSNNNLIYETAPYTQGLGLSYKENFNHLEELWQNFLALFGRGKNSAQ